MIFNSYIFFLCFLPVFLAGYFILRGRNALACKLWVAVMSLLFYVPFGVRNIAVLAASIVVNCALAQVIAGKAFASDNNTKSSPRPESARVLTFTAVALNLLTLLFFKFAGVFFPVAISFYTFNQISYLVDLYRGEVDNHSPLDQITYILFFPKLLQGPMMGYNAFAKELSKSLGSRIDWERVMRGLYLFSLGLFKKVILADTFGVAVDYGFDNIPFLGSLEALLVAVFYSFQLYFDFSGYCDMAAGVGTMMDFALPINFNSPYKAVNILDFWKRWHITLTGFFTKYVYIPLGGNRKGMARMYANLMIVFLLSGLWHGSGWTFIVWGAMHGILYVITRAIQKTKAAKTGADNAPKTDSKTNAGNAPKADTTGDAGITGNFITIAIKRLLTFSYVTAAWVFFRAKTAGDALLLTSRIFTGGRKPIATDLSNAFRLDELWYVIKVTPIMKFPFAWDVCLWLFTAVSVFMIFFRDNALNTAEKAKIGVKTTLVTAVLLIWCILTFAGVSTFLYMNF